MYVCLTLVKWSQISGSRVRVIMRCSKLFVFRFLLASQLGRCFGKGGCEGRDFSLFICISFLYILCLVACLLFFKFALLGSAKIFSLHCTLSFTCPLSLKTWLSLVQPILLEGMALIFSLGTAGASITQLNVVRCYTTFINWKLTSSFSKKLIWRYHNTQVLGADGWVRCSIPHFRVRQEGWLFYFTDRYLLHVLMGSQIPMVDT